MKYTDPRALIEDLQNVEVKLPLHQRALRERLLDVHAEQTSLCRRSLAKIGLRGGVRRQASGSYGLAPLVCMLVALIGLVVAGVIMFLSSGRPAPGQKLIVSTGADTSIKGSFHSSTISGGWECTPLGCSAPSAVWGNRSDAPTASGSNAPGSSGVDQKNDSTGNGASESGTLTVPGNATTSTSPSSSQSASQPSSLSPASPSNQPIVAVAIPDVQVSVPLDIGSDSAPGNSGNAAKNNSAKKAEKALAKAFKHLGL